MEKIIIIFTMVLLGVVFQANNHAFAFDTDTVKIHGFISQGYIDSSNKNSYIVRETEQGTFQFNEAGINFTTSLSDKLHLGIQFLARDLSHVGNDKLKVDWAVADHRFRDYLGFRAGLLKFPHGLYNETRDIDMLRTFIFLPSSLYAEFMRDLFANIKGVGIYGNIMEQLSYQIIAGTIEIDIDDGFVDAISRLLGYTASNLSLEGAYAINLKWEPLMIDGLRIGCSYAVLDSLELTGSTMGNTWRPIPIGTNIFQDFTDLSATTGSIEYIIGELTLAAEYNQYEFKFDFAIEGISPALYMTQLEPISNATMESYYASASYRFFYWFEMGAYYSVIYQSKDEKEDLFDGKREKLGYEKDYCLTFRFDVNASWVIKLEGHQIKGDMLSYQTEKDNRHWYAYAIKFTYSF